MPNSGVSPFVYSSFRYLFITNAGAYLLQMLSMGGLGIDIFVSDVTIRFDYSMNIKAIKLHIYQPLRTVFTQI